MSTYALDSARDMVLKKKRLGWNLRDFLPINLVNLGIPQEQ